MRLLETVARFSPREPASSEELRTAVAFLGWQVRPATLVRAADGVGVVVLAVGLLATFLASSPWRLAVATGSFALALGATHLVRGVPGLLATARRAAALGAAPELVVLAVLRMRLAPSPEGAAAFAAETASGPLARRLDGHVRRARGTAHTGLGRFGEDWDEWFPALGRALDLVVAAGSVPAADRARTLDRAMETVLDGTRGRMQDFAGSIRGPATALYAFGVLLPTALVALFPAARAAGLAVTPPVVAVVYDVCLPVLLVGASAWLLARRPVAFPSPRLDSSHPQIPDRRWLALGVGVFVGLAAALLVGRLFPSWAPPIASLGGGIGTALVVHYRPYVRVQREVRAVERGLTDVLSLVGRRVSTGCAVERAIEEAAEAVDGPAGDVFAAGARRGRRLDVGVREAFVGNSGVLTAVPSARVRGSVALLDTAAREGQPAGAAVVSMARHLDDLQTVERDAREGVRTVLETLRSTGAVFGPLVGGATVALADHMAGGVGLPGSTEPTPWLGFLVGWYVLVLAAVLTALSVGLERGVDRPVTGYRVGIGLLLATASFLCGYGLSAIVA